MKVYKTQSEIEKDIKNGVLEIEGDVKFECSFSISASIKVIAGDINAGNINAGNIDAGNIDARNIDAGNIDAGDINAGNIDARNIDAGNILYYAFCGVYQSIKCLSIKAKREKHTEPICLDGSLEIKKAEVNTVEQEAIEVLKKAGYKIIKN
jgi:hypothetical protein